MHDTAHAQAAQHAPSGFIVSTSSASTTRSSQQYYGLALVAVLVGMFLSWLMRIHLAWTNFAIPGLHFLSANGAAGNVMTPEYYLQLMTMHATIMVFFVLTTAPFAAFGNYFLPIQVGAEDCLPALQHDVVLGHIYCLPVPGRIVLRQRWAHSRRLDPYAPLSARWSLW